jgi:hypothetical protein
MANARIIDIVERSEDQAVGYEAADSGSDGSGRVDLLVGLAKAGKELSPWWSTARDKELGRLWKESNHMSLAVYNAQSKLVSLPFQVVARDQTNDEHVAQAKELTFLLTSGTQFGETWGAAYARFVEDLLTQDNGGFMEIIGGGSPDGPIVGMPTAVRHLDSQRCTRRADPIYPVRYYAEDGKRYLIHFTRVVYMSQMPSARAEMNGVGLCAVSRAADIAQNLMDILHYKQERLGSRPPNAMIVGKGVTGRQLMDAFYTAEQEANNQGQSRYSRMVAIGSENPDIEVDVVNLTHMEPFDEETSMNLGMYAIASAFGMDVQELWPTLTGGSSGDAQLRRMRSRSKFPAQTTSAVEAQFNYKVMPPHLELRFDFKDDEEDQQRAQIRDIRGRNRQREISSGTINVASARQLMFDDGDLDRVLLERMELEEGRLPDGSPVGLLFHDSDPVFRRHLKFPRGVDILVFNENDPDEMISLIQEKRSGVLKEWSSTTSDSKREKLAQAHGALDWVEKEYKKLSFASPNGEKPDEEEPPKQESTSQQQTTAPGQNPIAARAPKKPTANAKKPTLNGRKD